jgi:hypothetical protein
MQAKIGKASNCHTDGIKTKREERQVKIFIGQEGRVEQKWKVFSIVVDLCLV